VFESVASVTPDERLVLSIDIGDIARCQLNERCVWRAAGDDRSRRCVLKMFDAFFKLSHISLDLAPGFRVHDNAYQLVASSQAEPMKCPKTSVEDILLT